MNDDPRVKEFRERNLKAWPTMEKRWRKQAFREKGIRDPELEPRKKRELSPEERDWNEYDFQRHFNRWFSVNHDKFSSSCLIELKSTDGGTLNYKKIREVQRRSLENCSTAHGVYHQIQSNPNAQQSEKPSDSFFIRDAKGWLAVMFHQKKRGNYYFYMIPYPKLVEEESKGGESISEERALAIGSMILIEPRFRDK